MTTAVRTLKTDLKRLREVRRELEQSRTERKTDRKELAQDKKRLERQRDTFTSDRKELQRDRQALGALRDTVKTRLDELDARQTSLQAAYDASIDPLTGQGDANVKAQLDALPARRQELQAKLDAKVQEVSSGAATVTSAREAVKATRAEVKHDKSVLARDEKQVKRDHALVKKVRQRALKHLRPAEYQLGLRGTNRVRKALGLNAVNQVIRPGKRVTGYVNGVARSITVSPVGNGQYLRADAARSFLKMQAAARRAGISLSATSGFRTMAEQQHLYALYQAGQGNKAAVPGYSNHQGGVAMDIGGVGNYGTAAFNWLSANAGRFGFRNTVSGEFWHWSYGVNG